MLTFMYFIVAILTYFVTASYLVILRETHIMYGDRFASCSSIGRNHWWAKLARITLAGDHWDDAADAGRLWDILLVPLVPAIGWPLYWFAVFVGCMAVFVGPYLYPRTLIHKFLRGIMGGPYSSN